MTTATKMTLRQRKQLLVREAVIDAADLLLAESPKGDFSMRELALAAEVGFTTLFAQFGSKTEIIRGVAGRFRTKMIDDFRAKPACPAVFDSVLSMAASAVTVILSRPHVCQTIMGALTLPSLGGPKAGSGAAADIWNIALDAAPDMGELLQNVRLILPDQLTICFQGVLSLWAVGEVRDDDILPLFELSIGFLFYSHTDLKIKERIDGLIGRAEPRVSRISDIRDGGAAASSLPATEPTPPGKARKTPKNTLKQE